MEELESILRRSIPDSASLPDLAGVAADAGLLDVAYAIEDSPLGRLLLATTRRGVIRIAYLAAGEEAGQAVDQWVDQGVDQGVVQGVDEVLAELAVRVSPRVLCAPARLDQPRRELEEFFAGRRTEFEVRLDWRLIGAPFSRRVLQATSRIPFGAVSTYREVAAQAGSPRGFRAAGNALGANPIPIIVPCHRVLHSGGGLGGYTGGLDKKRVLLSLEGVGWSELAPGRPGSPGH